MAESLWGRGLLRGRQPGGHGDRHTALFLALAAESQHHVALRLANRRLGPLRLAAV